MDEQAILPDPPYFTNEDFQKFKDDDDFMPALFEWYKYVGQVCIYLAQIGRESLAVKDISPIHYAILTGLLNRCTRLMLSNIVLSHKGRFGETTAILDRCIFESSLNVRWLCLKNSEDYFERFLADGLKTEIELENKITENITDREGEVLVIEERMLKSIDNYIDKSGLTRDEINDSKKLPDIASILRDLGSDRLLYVVKQRLGSHHVHGTWPSLLSHYLEADEKNEFYPRDNNCETNPNQFVITPLLVLEALKAFITFVIEKEDAVEILNLLESIKEEIVEIHHLMVGNDFQSVN